MTSSKKRSYNMYEAKTQLSALVEQARGGDEVILMNRGKPVAKIVAIAQARKVRKFGTLKGKLILRPGWDRPIDDFKDYE